MPVLDLALNHLSNKVRGKKPFQGLRIAMCLHVSKETSVLVEGIHSLGADVKLVAANPLSSQDEIAKFLSSIGVSVSAKSGETVEEYTSSIKSAASCDPQLIVDDGGELHVAYSKTGSNSCFGGTDETTTGTTRLRGLYREGKLRYPVIPVNEAETKHIFDNKYGSGQSAIDGLLRATGLLLTGKTLVVAGYGWVGRGVAERARGMGARVVVTEVNGLKALEAQMDGYEVVPMIDAASLGDIFLTCTGQIEVLRQEHFQKMKNGAILGNVGHFDSEIDVADLYKMAVRVQQIREHLTRFELPDHRSILLLSRGRVINLVGAEGHPPEIMQLSFADQLLSLYYLLNHQDELKESKPKLLQFPKEIDLLVTKFAVDCFGLKIDFLTDKQKRYSESYSFSE